MNDEWVKPEDFEPWWDRVPAFVEFRKDGEIILASVEADESPDLTFVVCGVSVSKYDYDCMREAT